MKVKMFVIGFIFAAVAAYGQDYYWYKGEKISLQRGNRQYILYQDSRLNESDKAQLAYSEDIDWPDIADMKWAITKPDAVIEDLEHVIYQTQSYLTNDPERNVFVTHRFYVQLKSENDLTLLQDMAEQCHAVIEEKGTFALWYILRWDMGDQQTALELANHFYESGLFSAAEPEFINANSPANTLTEHINSDNSMRASKVLRNGILLIERGERTYSLHGFEVY